MTAWPQHQHQARRYDRVLARKNNPAAQQRQSDAEAEPHLHEKHRPAKAGKAASQIPISRVATQQPEAEPAPAIS
jgi:hypothetical protein